MSSINNTTIKRISGFFLIFFSILFLSCALAAPVKWLIDYLAAQFDLFKPIADTEIHRILSRIIIVLTVLSLIIFRKFIFASGKVFYILKPDKKDFSLFFIAFIFGSATLALHVALAILFGAREFYTTNFTWHKFLAEGIESFFSASLIGVLEEFLFRGILFGSLKKVFSLPISLGASSFIYSLLHFFKPKEINVNPDSILSGFYALGQMVKPLAGPDFLSESTGLFLVGMCLAAGYYFMRSLYFAIGLHAGWVFIIKMDGMVATRTVENKIFLWGSSNLVSGVFTWVLLVCIFLFTIYFLAPKLKKQTNMFSV